MFPGMCQLLPCWLAKLQAPPADCHSRDTGIWQINVLLIEHCQKPALSTAVVAGPCRRYWENPALGTWASQQRTDAKGAPRGALRRRPATLSEQKAALLNEIGFSWKVGEVCLLASPCLTCAAAGLLQVISCRTSV